MKKYGVEHFSIEVVEECSMEAVSDREIYWITYFNSYKNGYNATRGGDGKSFIDTNAIQTLWLSNKSLKEIQELTGYCKHTIRNVLYQLGVDKSCIMKRSKKNSYKAVNMYSKEGNLLMTFPSIANAIDYLKSNCIYKVSDSCCGHISSVCLGKRATAYGYRWEYK